MAVECGPRHAHIHVEDSASTHLPASKSDTDEPKSVSPLSLNA